MSLATRRFLAVALWLSILSAPRPAESQVYEGKQLVAASLVADTDAIVPGKPFTAGLLLKMVPGWHTYWKFSGDAGIPIELKWKLPPGWKAGELQWPIPMKFKDPGDIDTYGYHDEVLLTQQITPPASFQDSTVKLTADANWLVCEKICVPGSASLQIVLPRSTTSSPANAELFARFKRLLPQNWPNKDVTTSQWSRTGNDLLFKVKAATLAKYPFTDFYPFPPEAVVLGHPKVESRSGDEITFRIPLESAPPNQSSIGGLLVFGQAADSDDRMAWELPGPAVVSSTAPTPDRGIIAFLFLGFVGGLILNLMPCVLPVISLKIFGFIQHAGQSRRKILRSGLAFTAGIFAWFIGLALLLIVLRGAGHQIAWASLFTSPYFVLFMSVVVFVFALNLLGVFEISLPQSATRGLLGVTAQEGDAGSFFQGVFATVLATPCTAPYLGTALGFASYAIGGHHPGDVRRHRRRHGAPYLLLSSAQPAWMRFLPKPGPWMERLKQFMGFLLLATLLFLLYVLGAQRGSKRSSGPAVFSWSSASSAG